MELVSALTAWTLEDGAATAQSMTARGYGLRRCRSLYSRYPWQRRDGGLLAGLLVLAGALAWCWPQTVGSFAIYPRLTGLDWTRPVVWLALFLYVAILALPIGAQLWEEGQFLLWERRYGQQIMRKGEDV